MIQIDEIMLNPIIFAIEFNIFIIRFSIHKNN